MVNSNTSTKESAQSWAEELKQMYSNFLQKQEKERISDSIVVKNARKNKKINKKVIWNPIRTFEAYMKEYDLNDLAYKWPQKNIHESLNKIEWYLVDTNWNGTWILDPIEYLHYLYFTKEVWNPTIFNELWEYFHYKDYTKLNYLFRNVFFWKLRKNTDKSNWRNKIWIHNNKKRIEKENLKAKKLIDTILSWKDIKDINVNDYEELEPVIIKSSFHTKFKMLKVLSVISWKEEIKIIQLMISEMDNKEWANATAIASEIQKIFDNLWVPDANINRHTIQKLKKK